MVSEKGSSLAIAKEQIESEAERLMKIQGAIEAIDRAIEDEQRLVPGEIRRRLRRFTPPPRLRSPRTVTPGVILSRFWGLSTIAEFVA
jgi:hypothetical protein